MSLDELVQDLVAALTRIADALEEIVALECEDRQPTEED